jgi:hypothetical protein
MESKLPRLAELRSPDRALADLIERRQTNAFLRPNDRLRLDEMIRELEAEIVRRKDPGPDRRLQTVP